MMRGVFGAVTVTAALMGGCTSMANDTPEPAVLAETSPEIRAQITDVVSEALYGMDLVIADNSLMDTDRLIIERKPTVHEGVTVMTRDAPKVDHFRLKTSGKSCMLLHEQTGKTYPLDGISCKPMPTGG